VTTTAELVFSQLNVLMKTYRMVTTQEEKMYLLGEMVELISLLKKEVSQ